eukprot:2486620-Pleurochrysis_carterae.AAC.2
MPDPFEEVREDVSASLVGAQAQRARWERERSEESKHALLASMRHIDADLQEMTDALSAVERDRKRFAIDDAELRSRHAWIADARKQVEAHRAAVRAAETPSAKCCAKTGAVAAARRPAVTGDVASCGEAERDSLLPGGDGKKSAKGKGVKGVRQDAQLDPVVDAHTLQMTQMHVRARRAGQVHLRRERAREKRGEGALEGRDQLLREERWALAPFFASKGGGGELR